AAATIARRHPQSRGEVCSLVEVCSLARLKENASSCTPICTTRTALHQAVRFKAVVYGHAMTATSAAIKTAEPETASVLSYRSATRCCSTRRASDGSDSTRVGVDGRAGEVTAALSDEDGLRTVADIESLEHRADVCLYRAFRDIERACGLFVGESAAEHADDFELPQRQARRVGRGCRVRCRRNEYFAGEHFLDRGDHLVGRERLRNESRCTGGDCACRDAFVFVAGDHDARRRREALTDDAQCIETVVALQMNIEQDEPDLAVAL